MLGPLLVKGEACERGVENDRLSETGVEVALGGVSASRIVAVGFWLLFEPLNAVEVTIACKDELHLVNLLFAQVRCFAFADARMGCLVGFKLGDPVEQLLAFEFLLCSLRRCVSLGVGNRRGWMYEGKGFDCAFKFGELG